MRGLDLVIGYVLGNKTARTWCLNKLKQASVTIDKEMKKSPLGVILCTMVPEKEKPSVKDTAMEEPKKSEKEKNYD